MKEIERVILDLRMLKPERKTCEYLKDYTSLTKLAIENYGKVTESIEIAIKILQSELDRLEGCEWVTIPINFGMRCRYICSKCEYHSEHKYSFCPSCGRKSKLKELRGGEDE